MKGLIIFFCLLGLCSSVTAQRKMKVTATAYTSHPSENGGNSRTKTGTRYKPGFTIAVDPRHIPLGSTIVIPSIGFRGKAEDTGGAIKGRRIDLCLASRSQTSRFGRRSVEIIVYPPHQDDKATSKRNSRSPQSKKRSKNRSS